MSFKMYQRITAQIIALIESESDLIANLSNISALLNLELEDINWVGFYLLKQDELVLGPFQGNPACARIAVGQGVCGTAILENSVQRIDNVHEFEGHIACDAQSNSELVIPFTLNNQLVGVLDIDSPSLARFTQDDEKALVDLMKQVESELQIHI